MAKQGINPLEQHVEKIVVGVAMLLFALVVFNYVISTPVMVNVSNQRIPPGELDRKLGDAAQQVADMYKRATWVPPVVDKPDTSGPLDDMNKAKDMMAKAPPPMVSPVAWGTDVAKPKGDSGVDGGKHGLATVMAPTISDVSTGVTYAGLVAQPASLTDSAAGNSATVAAATVSQDVVWGFLRLHFDMQEQYEIFRQNGYSREQANLILFLDIQAQRQRVYPDGSTGPWEDFQPYRTVQAVYPQAMEIRNGALGYADEQTMRTLFSSLVPEQMRILYPLPTIMSPGSDPFPPYYAGGVPPTPMAETASAAAPTTPKPPVVRQPPRPTRPGGGGAGGMRPGGGGEMRPGGGSEMRPGGGAEMRPGSSAAPRPVQAASSADRDAIIAANQALRDAKKAYDEKRYLEAKQILDRVQNVPAVQRQMIELLQKVNEDYEKWRGGEEKLAAKKASDEARNAEIWVYDMQAPAGKTYRYRAKVLLLNVYAHPDSDRMNELKNPQDGAKVALAGDWSAPSAPITLADSRRFFFTAGAADTELASIDVFRFQQGRWFKDVQRKVGIGDAIGDIKVNVGGSGIDVDYRTNFVVVDIGTDQAATVGSDKGSKVSIKRQQSPVLVSMDADGTIQSRWSAVDRLCPMSKELEAKVKASVEPPLPSTAATGLAR